MTKLIVCVFFSVLSFLACASSSGQDQEIGSRIDYHMKKFKSYFRVHTSREHAAERKAREKAQMEQEDKERMQQEYAQTHSAPTGLLNEK